MLARCLRVERTQNIYLLLCSLCIGIVRLINLPFRYSYIKKDHYSSLDSCEPIIGTYTYNVHAGVCVFAHIYLLRQNVDIIIYNICETEIGIAKNFSITDAHEAYMAGGVGKCDVYYMIIYNM